jgi:hypothetical protein
MPRRNQAVMGYSTLGKLALDASMYSGLLLVEPGAWLALWVVFNTTSKRTGAGMLFCMYRLRF